MAASTSQEPQRILPPPRLTIRPVRYSDILPISHMCAAAFMDDSLVGETMHPNRNEHPHDVYLGFLRSLRVKYWDYKCAIYVATIPYQTAEEHMDRSGNNIDDSRNDVIDVLSAETREKINSIELLRSGQEIIVGVADWKRFGTDKNAKARLPWQYDPRNVFSTLIEKVNSLHEFTWPNRAADPANQDIAARSAPYWISLFSPPRSECWYLSKCGVHPYFQGKSIGKKLVAVGTVWATQEKICAALTSSMGKDGFYQNACGFKEQYGDMCAGEGNPMGILKGRGGKVYWYWPEGVERPMSANRKGPSTVSVNSDSI